jgi:hypothetical protein
MLYHDIFIHESTAGCRDQNGVYFQGLLIVNMQCALDCVRTTVQAATPFSISTGAFLKHIFSLLSGT